MADQLALFGPPPERRQQPAVQCACILSRPLHERGRRPVRHWAGVAELTQGWWHDRGCPAYETPPPDHRPGDPYLERHRDFAG